MWILRTLVIAMVLLLAHQAAAQNNNCQQYLQYSAQLTPAQWQFCFSQKQDAYPSGGTPLSNVLPPGQTFVGNSSAVATARALSGDVASVSATGGVTLISTLHAIGQAASATYSTLVQTTLGAYEWIAGPVNAAGIGASTASCAFASCLRTNTIPWPTIHVPGYYGAGTLGGGDFELVSGTSPPDDNCLFFVDAANHVYRRTGYSLSVDPIICGARGDGISKTDGSANGTTTFTSASGNCVNQLAAGMTHIVIFPAQGTTNVQVDTTIASCGSATSYVLSAGPSWSGSDLYYSVGHNDAAFVGYAMALTTANGTLVLSQPIYISSGSSGLGTFGGSIVGFGASPSTIIVSGLGGSTNGLELSGNTRPVYENFGIDCGYSGQQCLGVLSEIGGARFSNLLIEHGNQDCLAIHGAGGIQNTVFDNIDLEHCGRHGLIVDLTSPGYFNTSLIEGLTVHGVSERQANGAAIFGNSPGFQSQGDHVVNAEFDAQYGTPYQSTYRPRTNAVYFNSGGWVWDFSTITTENTSGVAVCASVCAPLGLNFGSANLLTNMESMEGQASWATISFWGRANAEGIISLASSGGGATAALLSNQSSTQMVGTLGLFNADAGGNSSFDILTIAASADQTASGEALSSGLPLLTGSGKTFTKSFSGSGGVSTFSVTNTSGVATTFVYSYLSTGSFGIVNSFLTQ